MNKAILRRLIPVLCFSAISSTATSTSTAAAVRGEGALRRATLDAHNDVRADAGVPPIVWDEKLAQSALAYAAQMALSDAYRHDRTPGRRRLMGENIWRGTRGAFDYRTMLGMMAGEGRNFRPGIFPNVSRSGRWSDVGHYTQMVWPTTTHVGCALASSARFDYLVCRYSPPGNKDGVRLG